MEHTILPSSQRATWPFAPATQGQAHVVNGDHIARQGNRPAASLFPSRQASNGVNGGHTYAAPSISPFGEGTNDANAIASHVLIDNSLKNGLTQDLIDNALASRVLIDNSQKNGPTQDLIDDAQESEVQSKPAEVYRIIRNGTEYIHNGIKFIRNGAAAEVPPSQIRKQASGKRSRSVAQRLDMEQYLTVTDVDLRLHELEKEELERFEKRQEALKSRQIKDAELKRKRDAEDERWKEDDALHEEEENVLRQKRKQLRRQSVGLADPQSHPELALLTPDDRSLKKFRRSPSLVLSSFVSANQGLRTRDAPPKRKYRKSEKHVQRSGPPDGRDKYGRFAWRRASDGQMVTIDCVLPGCAQRGKTFNTLHGLLMHISKDHHIKLNGREDVLNRCGDIANMGSDKALDDAVEGTKTEGVNDPTVSSSVAEPWAIPDFQNLISSVETSGEDRQGQDELQLLANAVVNNMVGVEAINGVIRVDESQDQDEAQIHADTNMVESQAVQDNTESRLSQVHGETWTYQRDGISWASQDKGETWTADQGTFEEPTANGTINKSSEDELPSPQVKKEVASLNGNGQPRFSSLFGSENGGDMEDTMNGINNARRLTPDDIFIERLLEETGNNKEVEAVESPGTEGGTEGATDMTRNMQEGTPDDVRVARLLGGLSASAWASL